MRRRAIVIGAALFAVLLAAALLCPALALAGGNDLGQNLASLLRREAGAVYGGIVAVIGLVFLLNRRYTELGMFFIAAIVVGWLVFSPDQIANAARAIGRQVLP